MLYYLLFWAILGFIIHFYIIFGTNLLTGGPAQICCFMPISVFWRKGISDGVETERNKLEKLFLEGNTPDGLGPHVRRYGSCPRGWFGTILMYRELCYYSWILCFFSPLLSCNESSFPFEVILSDWVFKDLRTLDVCLVVDICWWQWDTTCHLMYVLVTNLRVSWHWEPMHRGWHTFSSWFSGRTLGHSLRSFDVGWIDESEIVWCISYNHTHGYLRWHWSI